MKKYFNHLKKFRHLLPRSQKSLGPKVLIKKISCKILDLFFFKRKVKPFKIKKLEDWNNFAYRLSPALNVESKIFFKNHLTKLYAIEKNISFKMGGPAGVRICYFLVRLLKPNVVLETGVAIGNSSRAILSGLQRNRKGNLYSSDLPYLSQNYAKKYIGIIVEQKLRYRWNLYIGQDAENLNFIKSKLKKIDFLHYDSDKSYHGRKAAIEMIEKNLSSNYVLVMDDIEDNAFFFDFVRTRKLPYKIFMVDNKYVGLTGKNKLVFNFD